MAKEDKTNDILAQIRDDFKTAYDFWDPSYCEMIEDLEFIDGENQWPADVKNERIADGRPCLTINKIPAFCDQIIGDVRQNSPSIKIKPVDSGADPDTAEVITGLIRNIEQQSDAEIAYDTAVESAVQCGKGTFRIGTRYADDDVFDQDIYIDRIKNPFTVYWDPAAQKWDKSDARYCFVTEKVSRDDFTRMYPKASLQEFSGGNDRVPNWGDDKSIRIAEYFVKEPVTKTIYLLKNPVTGETQVSDKENPLMEVVQTRTVETHKLMWYKTNGAEILEGPTEMAGRYIPIVEVWGKELNIEGKTTYRGAIKHAKDAQRLYNYSRSHNAEVTSLAPKSPYIVKSSSSLAD